MTWISFGTLPCTIKNLTKARVSTLLKSCTSLSCFQACFVPGLAKDLSAPRYMEHCNKQIWSCTQVICTLIHKWYQLHSRDPESIIHTLCMCTVITYRLSYIYDCIPLPRNLHATKSPNFWEMIVNFLFGNSHETDTGPMLQENLGTKLDVTDIFQPNAGDALRYKSCLARPYYREEHKPQVARGRMTKFSRLVPNICGPSTWNLLHVTLLAPRIFRFVTVGEPGNSLERNYYYWTEEDMQLHCRENNKHKCEICEPSHEAQQTMDKQQKNLHLWLDQALMGGGGGGKF